MPNSLFPQKDEPDSNSIAYQNTFDTPPLNRFASEQIDKIAALPRSEDISSVHTISFDVEDDGKGNNVIGITFPNTNLSAKGTQKRSWRKWLERPLIVAAIIILIVLVIYFYRDHQ